MKKMDNFTITTPLYYVNDKPHLGSTYTTIVCDTIARFNRLEGKRVKFITGVDEHGQKIQRTAKSKNTNPLEYCDLIASKYINLWKKLDISNDIFIRTTNPFHETIVKNFYQKVLDSKDIIKDRQQGWYCVGCEEYKEQLKGSDSKPVCPIHLKELEWRDEENLFFKLSKYQDQIEKLVKQDDFINPRSRRNEIINFVENGLTDFSISRINVPWALSVPNEDGHTFYVWFDALLGYISACLEGQRINSLNDLSDYGWPASVHIIGKDILRFHAVYWPAMLLSAGMKPPLSVFGHGFLTREGQKMGK